MNISYKSLIFAVAVNIIGFTSCQKEDFLAEDSAMAQDEMAFAPPEVDDIPEMLFIPSNHGELKENRETQPEFPCKPLHKLPEGATLSESSESFPKTITIDFGDRCVGKHGEVIKGKVIIEVSAHLLEEGATQVQSFDGFSVGERQISGIRKLENKGINSSGNPELKKTVALTINGPKGAVEKEFNGSMELLLNDSQNCEHAFLLSGSGSLSGDKGKHTKTILEPLLIQSSCKHPLSGVVEMNGERGTAELNFGDGTCDNLATLTKNGETEEIDLEKPPKHCKKRK